MSATATNIALLEIRGLRAGYGRSEVLRGIDLRLEQGRIATIIGANGAGKTTTLLAISGLVPPRAGSIEFSGERIDGRRPDEIAQRGIGRTFQIVRPFPALTSHGLFRRARPRRPPRPWPWHGAARIPTTNSCP